MKLSTNGNHKIKYVITSYSIHYTKLYDKWFNHQYLITKSDEELAVLFAPIVKEKGIATTLDYLTKVIAQVKDRANFVTDLWNLSDYFFVAPTSYDEKATKKWNEETKGLLQKVIEQLNFYADFTSLTIENSLKDWMTANEIGMGKVMQPLRS